LQKARERYKKARALYLGGKPATDIKVKQATPRSKPNPTVPTVEEIQQNLENLRNPDPSLRDKLYEPNGEPRPLVKKQIAELEAELARAQGHVESVLQEDGEAVSV
jgi:hypothetical protein